MEKSLIENLMLCESVLNGTNLVTLYIPVGTNLWLVRDHINKEIKTSTNIKNKNIGKSVKDALNSINYKLKMLDSIPPNGICLCAGNFNCPSNIPITCCL
jgi:peptide subunit release factor 1 (eRF1)